MPPQDAESITGAVASRAYLGDPSSYAAVASLIRNRCTIRPMTYAQTIDWGATAAWAQAFLTGAAVFAAATLQDRSFQKRDNAAINENREAAIAVIQVAARRLSWLADSLEAEGRYTIILSGRGDRALATVARALDRIPLPGLRNGESIASVAEAQGIVTFAESYCAEFKGVIESAPPANRGQLLSDLANEFRAMGRRVEDHAAGIARRHGLPLAQLTGTKIAAADAEEASA